MQHLQVSFILISTLQIAYNQKFHFHSAVLIVVGGSTFVYSPNRYAVQSFIIHPSLDIALIKIDGEFAQPMFTPIALSTEFINADVSVVIFGWGSDTTAQGPNTLCLKWQNQTTLNNTRCQEYYNSSIQTGPFGTTNIQDSQICTANGCLKGACSVSLFLYFISKDA